MAKKSKKSENIVRLKCSKCNRTNYFIHKNKKAVQHKIELKKYCPWCRASILHKEVKK